MPDLVRINRTLRLSITLTPYTRHLDQFRCASDPRLAPTLFDFGNPLEVRVEPIAAAANAQDEAATPAPSQRERAEDNIQCNVDDITAELVRLLEERSEPQPTNAATGEGRERPAPQVD